MGQEPQKILVRMDAQLLGILQTAINTMPVGSFGDMPGHTYAYLRNGVLNPEIVHEVDQTDEPKDQ